MNIWKAKKKLIMADEYRDIPQGYDVVLDENDFNTDDMHFIHMLGKLYSSKVVENSDIIEVDGCYFIFHKEDIKKLESRHFDALVFVALSAAQTETNPLFMEIDENGCLCMC